MVRSNHVAFVGYKPTYDAFKASAKYQSLPDEPSCLTERQIYVLLDLANIESPSCIAAFTTSINGMADAYGVNGSSHLRV